MIKDLIEKEGPVNSIFMIKSAVKATSSTGAFYLSIVLQDMSGTLDAKMWQITEGDIELAKPGTLVRIEGIMLNYKGHPQLKINSLDLVYDDTIDISKYVPVAPIKIEDLKVTLADYINMIEDSDLKTLVEKVINTNYEKYTTYPAAVSIHHAYYGGILYHSLSICKMALDMCDHYPFLSKDYMIAGSLLHDIGKIYELSGTRATTYTTEGNLLGHIALGAMIVYHEGKKLHTDSEKLEVLVHMILSHHGEQEFGSPKTPLTREAYTLHVLDDLDAKLDCINNYYKGVEEGQLTSRIPWMDNNMFYKPYKTKKGE